MMGENPIAPASQKKKEKERARLWRLLHVEHHLRRHAGRLRYYPKAAPDVMQGDASSARC